VSVLGRDRESERKKRIFRARGEVEREGAKRERKK
jgi:hypothetical protein